MNLEQFDSVLYLDDPDFARKFTEAIGLKPGEKLEICTPQFERTDGCVVTYIPKTPEEYEAIRLLDRDARKRIGMGCWGDVPEGSPDAKDLWLFPHEWYSSIPGGLEIVDICGNAERFAPCETDDDMRFGLLAFGFLYEPESC